MSAKAFLKDVALPLVNLLKKWVKMEDESMTENKDYGICYVEGED